MSNEASKSRPYISQYLSGTVLDIGCGADPITPSAQCWDFPNGDAQYLPGLRPESFDTVFSAHCLEHLRNPNVALARWWSLVKPGGHLVLIVPDEDAYEQGLWPSAFNGDHKATFTTSKDISWCPASYSVVDLVRHLPGHRLERLERRVLKDPEADPFEDLQDATAGIGMAQIELILCKAAQPALRSPLRQLFACSGCFREVVAVGVRPDGRLACRCTHCGLTGTYSLT